MAGAKGEGYGLGRLDEVLANLYLSGVEVTKVQYDQGHVSMVARRDGEIVAEVFWRLNTLTATGRDRKVAYFIRKHFATLLLLEDDEKRMNRESYARMEEKHRWQLAHLDDALRPLGVSVQSLAYHAWELAHLKT